MNEQQIFDKRRYARFRYSENALAQALQEIREGHESINGASKKYNIPKSTLHNKLNGKVPASRRMGPTPFLNEAEENRLEGWIIAKAKLGFPMHPSDVKDAVQNILTECGRPNTFKDNRPGEKWMKLFLRRHPTIAKRNTEIISKSRAAVTEDSIRDWFRELTNYLGHEKLLDSMMNNPSRIYNADETGVRTCVKSGLILGPVAKNFKNLYEITSGNEKESITVLCNYSANGIAVPPMVVFPYKRIPKVLALSVPADWGIGRSDTGWMTGATFYEYVANVFHKWLIEKKIEFPVILFIDGHKSHYSIELYEFCVKENIILYCLFPNSTHILQPCDVTIFRPLKVEWKKICQNHKQKTSVPITKYNFCPLFKEAFDNASLDSTIINGFRTCGIYPLDPDAVDYSKCISSRRKEIFPKVTEENKDLTAEDYMSCLKVMRQILGKTKIDEFYERFTNETESEESLYSFWKSCKVATDTAHSTPVETDNGSAYMLHLTEELLDNIPVEIDGVLYQQKENEEFETLTFDHSDLFSDDILSGSMNYDELLYATIKDSLDENKNDVTIECAEILESILNIVFEIVENTAAIITTSAQQGNANCSETNKIKILTNIEISGKKATITEAHWRKHLHWPQLQEKNRKRKASEKMPYAVTSKKWLEYYEKQENDKKNKDEEIKQRKLEREQKRKSQIKKTKTKHKRKTDKDEELTNKENDEITYNRKAKRNKTDNVQSLQRDNTIDLFDSSHNVVTSKFGKLSQIENKETETTMDTLSVGDYVIVLYDDKRYPGLIINIEKKEYEVSVMHQTKKMWKWPKPEDKIWYKRSQILKRISEPKPNVRGVYNIAM